MTLKEQAIHTLNHFKKAPNNLCTIAGTHLNYPELKDIIQRSVDNYHKLINYQHNEFHPFVCTALLPEYDFDSDEFYEARVIFMEELIKQL